MNSIVGKTKRGRSVPTLVRKTPALNTWSVLVGAGSCLDADLVYDHSFSISKKGPSLFNSALGKRFSFLDEGSNLVSCLFQRKCRKISGLLLHEQKQPRNPHGCGIWRECRIFTYAFCINRIKILLFARAKYHRIFQASKLLPIDTVAEKGPLVKGFSHILLIPLPLG